MKTILMSTDFSVPAENAAKYAVELAKVLKANVVLCHAVPNTKDTPTAAQVAWPLMDEEELGQNAESNLAQSVNKLLETSCEENEHFCPEISFFYKEGKVVDVVTDYVKRKQPMLVVMGLAGAGKVVQWALGSNSQQMIDDAKYPVLYIPFKTDFKPLKKIIFATDLQDDSLDALQNLVEIARAFEAEIFVYHVTNYENKRLEEQQQLDQKFNQHVVAKLGYDKIKYYSIWYKDVQEALQWMRNEKDTDMIALIHREHSLLDMMVNGSHTHKLSRFINIPLLVYPSKK